MTPIKNYPPIEKKKGDVKQAKKLPPKPNKVQRARKPKRPDPRKRIFY